MKKAYKYFFYISLILGLLLFISAEFIIIYSFGKEYIESIPLLELYSLAILFSSIGAINSIYLKVTNLQKRIMSRHILNVVLNVVLNYFLIYQYGVIGSVYATLIALFVSTVLYDLFDKKLKIMNRYKLSIFTLTENDK
jgi:O-antigen/teichoic acid export membrane protein